MPSETSNAPRRIWVRKDDWYTSGLSASPRDTGCGDTAYLREDVAAARLDAMTAERDRLRELLREGRDQYADHQSWRCGHQDRYPHNPRCPCGLTEYLGRVDAALSTPKQGDDA